MVENIVPFRVKYVCYQFFFLFLNESYVMSAFLRFFFISFYTLYHAAHRQTKNIISSLYRSTSF